MKTKIEKYRNCPTCNIIIKYTDNGNYTKAVKMNGKCKKCCLHFNYLKNKKKRLEQSKIYRLKNIDIVKEKRREYYNKVKHTEEYKNKVLIARPIRNLKTSLKEFNLSMEEYNIMLLKQKGLCAICKKKPKERYRLNIDHNHNTGKIRGLLCRDCNLGLGNFKDSVESLNNAKKYIINNN